MDLWRLTFGHVLIPNVWSGVPLLKVLGKSCFLLPELLDSLQDPRLSSNFDLLCDIMFLTNTSFPTLQCGAVRIEHEICSFPSSRRSITTGTIDGYKTIVSVPPNVR